MNDPRRLFDLTGRVACITGASSGLGQRAAITLAAAGAKVVCVARRREALGTLAEEIGQDAAAVPGDVADRDTLPALIDRITGPFGAPDIVVHAAGVNTREAADDVTPAGWDQTIALNLSAPFFLSQALVPAMAAKGWGRIVNFASLQTFEAVGIFSAETGRQLVRFCSKPQWLPARTPQHEVVKHLEGRPSRKGAVTWLREVLGRSFKGGA